MKGLHVLIGILVVFSLWLLLGVFLPPLMSESVSAGTFGDQFGAVNALFSGLAFAGVIYAVILQSKELELQRSELEQTREVLREQKAQLEEQNKTMQQQRFENTFFQMLSLNSETVTALEWSNVKGRAVASKLFSGLSAWLAKSKADPNFDVQNTTSYLAGYEATIGNFFEGIKATLQVIDQALIENKNSYADILASQLSRDELLLVFYYALGRDNENFKVLVERYSLFKRLKNQGLGFPDDKEYYQPSAFGD